MSPSLTRPGPPRLGAERRQAPREGDADLRHLLRGAYSLVANTVLTGLLGIGFWVLAARIYPQATVGLDSALIALMGTISAVCQLNLANVFARFLPQAARPGRMIALGYAASALLALAAAGVTLVVAPMAAPRLAFVRETLPMAVVWLAAVPLWGVFALQDAALTGLRWAPWVPVENGAFGVLKLAALPIFALLGFAHGTFLSWTLPMAVLVVPVNVVLVRRALRGHMRARGSVAPLQDRFGPGLRRFLVLDYVGTVLAQSTLTALPLVVVARLGGAANAVFYLALIIVLVFDVLFFNMGMSLVVEGAFREQHLSRLSRAIVRRAAILLAAGVAVLVAAAPLVLLIFGHRYADQGAAVLRVLALACVPRAVTTFYLAILRSRGRGVWIVALEAAQCVVVIALALWWAHPLGLMGIAWAWLAGSLVPGLVSAVPLARVLLGISDGRRRSGAMTPASVPASSFAVGSPPPVEQNGTGSAGDGSAPAAVRALSPGRSAWAGRTGGVPAHVAVATAACVAGGAAATGLLPGPIALAATLAFVLFGAGAVAVLPLRSVLGRGWAQVVAGALGVSVTMLVAEWMLWSRLWRPRPVLSILVGTCLALVWVQWIGETAMARRSQGAAEGASRDALTRSRRPPWRACAHVAILAGALTAWAVAIPGVDPGRIGALGLFNTLPVWLYVSFALLVFGAGWLLVGRWRSTVMVFAYGLAIVAVLHATTALAYDTVRLPWAYKHVGVTRYFVDGGPLNRGIDIYNNWPGFFGLAAFLSAVSHVDPVALARWAPVALESFAAVGTAFAVAGVERRPRRVAAAALLFVLGDWVDQNYFSPQGLAFPLVLVLLGLAIRLPAGTGPWRPFARRIAPPSPSVGTGALSLRDGALCGLPIAAAVITSHQLSPIMLIAGLAALAIAGRRPLWRAIVALSVMEVVWVWLARGILSRFPLLTWGVQQAAPQANVGVEPGLTWSLVGVRGVTAFLLALGVLGAVRRRRAREPMLALVALVAAPFAVAAVQSYGGEGQLRAYLFALPWLGVLAASALLPDQAVRRARASRWIATGRVGVLWLTLPALALTGAGSAVAMYAVEGRSYVPPSDVHAVAWFETHAPRGASLAYLRDFIPADATASYHEYDEAFPFLDSPQRTQAILGARSKIRVLRRYLDSIARATPVYFMVGPNQLQAIRIYGVLPASDVHALLRGVSSDPEFKVVFREGATTLWRYVPSGSTRERTR